MRSINDGGARHSSHGEKTTSSVTGGARRHPGRHKSAGQRWRRRIAVLALAVVALAGLVSIPGVPGHDLAALSTELLVSNAASAVSKVTSSPNDSSSQPCASLISTYGVGNRLLKNSDFGFYASVWPSYQALTAMDVASLSLDHSACAPIIEQTLSAIGDNYWDKSLAGWPAAYDQGPRPFHIRSDLPRVDDSLWMGLAVMQEYARAKNPALLDRAEDVFQLAVRNWDPRGGGIYWEATGAGNSERAVVSNAPAAILGVEIFEQVHHSWYLQWSKTIVSWLTRDLRDPTTGLYDDHVGGSSTANSIDTAKYTYTQGTMVGALAILSQVDPTVYPLSDAVDLAERSMTYFASHHSYGQPGFDDIWVENVFWLASLYKNSAFTAKAQATLDLSLAAEPKAEGDLLTTSSELVLRQLAELPVKAYARLLYANPDHRGLAPDSNPLRRIPAA